jgi:hypothetical protein
VINQNHQFPLRIQEEPGLMDNSDGRYQLSKVYLAVVGPVRDGLDFRDCLILLQPGPRFPTSMLAHADNNFLTLQHIQGIIVLLDISVPIRCPSVICTCQYLSASGLGQFLPSLNARTDDTMLTAGKVGHWASSSGAISRTSRCKCSNKPGTLFDRLFEESPNRGNLQ